MIISFALLNTISMFYRILATDSNRINVMVNVMIKKYFHLIPIYFGLCAQTASAQIISQSPRPEMPVSASEDIANIKPIAKKGRSGAIIQTPKAGALLFASFDSNSDYIIDKSEISSGIKAAFIRADRDKDGKLSLIELEAWRVQALGSEYAAPSNYAFAPNFARSVSAQKFGEVLHALANKHDKDETGKTDGKIAMKDLLKDYRPPKYKKTSNCIEAVRQERRRAEQQCRTRRRY